MHIIPEPIFFMDHAPIVTMDEHYDLIYTNLQSHPYVMFQKRVKMMLRDGALIGIVDGKQRPVVKMSTFNGHRNAVRSEQKVRIDSSVMAGSKKKSHAYLDNIATLAHMKGFPLYAVEYIAEKEGLNSTTYSGGFERILDVDLMYFCRILDIYRGAINDGKYELITEFY